MMKVQTRTGLWSGILRRLVRWSGHPVAEQVLRSLAALAVGFVLAGASAAGTYLPLSVALAAGLHLSLPAFAAYAGGCVGYVVFWGVDTAVEPMAAGLLVEACACIFGDQVSRKNRWFGPGCAMLFTALVGFLFLLERRFVPDVLWRYVLRIAVAGGAAFCFRRAVNGADQMCRLVFLACLCAGLCAVRPVGLPLGLVAGCLLAAAAVDTPLALPVAVLCGLALDISWGGGCVTAVLTLCALACQNIQRQLPRLGLWLGCALLGVLLTGTDYMLLAAALPGAVLAQFLPGARLFGLSPAAQSKSEQRLQMASGLLEQLSLCLTQTRPVQPDPETAAVFDQAAERVCRMCSLWDQCWGKNLEETCDELNRAAPAMMGRGKALRDDLPASFVNRCRHLEGFLTAVNRELDDLSCRRQYRSRLRESRAVLARQYHALSQALSYAPPKETVACRFQPELGFRSQGCRGDSLSGDQGTSFQWGRWYFVLLCDGMGTGKGAAAEAGAAIQVLKTLIQSGVKPTEAMQLLNGVYILRDDGGFSTVDLLQADLVTGEARLYKWGAAPSYLKRRGSVEKIGTASPPPGLGVGEAHRPEGAKLSLSRGEMLVLVSDGAGGEAAERFIRQYGGLSPKELASGVVSCTQSEGEDDRTAAVLALRPCISL